jgi:hypothetical protein
MRAPADVAEGEAGVGLAGSGRPEENESVDAGGQGVDDVAPTRGQLDGVLDAR